MYQQIYELKEQGNRQFLQANYKESIKNFQQALKYLSLINEEEMKSDERDNLIYLLYFNRAKAYYELKQYHLAYMDIFTMINIPKLENNSNNQNENHNHNQNNNENNN